MSEPDGTKSPSSPATPQFHLQPTTPEIPPRYPPTIARRMQEDKCFRCQQQGHWARDCPRNSSNYKPLFPSPINNSSSSVFPKRIFCRCGHGICEVKTSRSDNNPGRMYYACPIKRGATCPKSGYGFVKWCDEDVDQSFLQPPEFEYPVCRCKAGVCRRVKGSNSEGDFFTCPLKLEHGSCGYCVSEAEVRSIDSISTNLEKTEVLDGKSTVPIQQSRQRTIYELLGGLQNDDADTEMGNVFGIEGELLVKTKRMKITDNSESPSSVAVPEIPVVEDEGAAVKSPEPNNGSFQDIEFDDDDDVLWDIVADEALSSLPTSPVIQGQQSASYMQNLDASLSNDAAEEAPFSSLSTPGVRDRQSEFQRDMFEASLDSFPLDWIGRLLFFHPMQSLKSRKPQPYFCCVFPSFDPIVVPKQATILDDPCKYNQLAISGFNLHAQISTGFHSEVSRDVASLDKSPYSERKPVPTAEIHKHMVSSMPRQLLTILESFGPHQHESMRKEAETAFAMLNYLGIDCKQFSAHVWNFINLASSIAELDKSMESSLTLEEHHKLLEEEKARLAQIQNECVNNEVILEACKDQRQLLLKEVFDLESILQEKENQLKSCELETSKIATRLDDLRRSKLEADKTLKDRAEEAEEARKRHEERKVMNIAAKIALDKAKLELEN